ncbi:MAG: amino acid adenylation domain-containing protein, partial [Alphaproteobacteria bacterium]|nr:amino acid adenylation domain-containing protein [Alphaproteobacteria bacterium]
MTCLVYCINYHDAPLPRYAGVHATSWAILNNESTHAISWHIMNSSVDTGNILKQVFFSIDNNETALSLNLKCYVNALEAFKELIKEIGQKSIKGKSQDLKNRSYYSRSQKPSCLGFVSWENSAQDIERLYRALHFGEYPNTFAVFKVFINQQIFSPANLQILQSCSKIVPGTITHITDQAIFISTQTEDISISYLRDLKGNICSIDTLISQLGITVGDVLRAPDEQFLKDLQIIYTDLSHYETFWTKQLTNLSPAYLPFTTSLPQDAQRVKDDEKQVEIIITENFLEFSSCYIKELSFSFTEILIAAFLIYLSRLGNVSPFTIGFINPFLKELSSNLSSFFSSYVPLTFSLKSRTRACDILVYIKDCLALIQKNKSYCKDIYLRHPELQQSILPLPILIELVTPQTKSFTNQSGMILVLDEENKAYTLKVKSVQDDASKALLKNFSEHIRTLFEGIMRYPEKTLEQIPLLTSPECHQLLIEWNDTRTACPNHKSIQELFEEQVKKNPHNIAVIYEDQELTYQQLNERANQLAHHLRILGVGPDTLVAISVERSLEMIIGLIGILKAGGAYVPLDPSYPQERLQFMLDDTRVSILITQAHLQDIFKNHRMTLLLHWCDETKELLIEEKSFTAESSQTQRWISPSAETSKNLASLTTPYNLAYVIYTSGSTGKPKGVMIDNRGLSNRLTWMQDKYTITPKDRVLQKTSFTFDVSVWELFWPLLVGSTEVIASPELHKDPNLLSNLIVNKRVSICHFVPSMLATFLNIKKLLENNPLRFVIVSGDILPYELVKKFYSKLKVQLHNLYGPTEASIDVTSYQCVLNNDSVSPIGRPISNTQIYILDSYQNPVPIGINGEIYIGGTGLARGYFNRPDLTAERFIPNPFATEHGIQEDKNLRLYRTGDLARYLSDGNIEFLSRIDDQVKIRGFRIELGEIESVLQSHGGVNQAIVVTREDDPDHKKLIAYVALPEEKISSFIVESSLSSSAGEPFSILSGENILSLTEDLRNHLERSLPDYMIPSFFVYIDKVPLTPNGKIDRKALPTPDLSLRQIREEYIIPQTALEQDLCYIWKDVLKLEKIGVHDNFFKLGGHSLLATQIISRIRDNYHIDIPLRSLFEQPTLATLSQIVDSLKKSNTLSSRPPLLARERKGSIPLSFAQQRLWFLDQLLPEVALYNIPIALKLKGPLDIPALESAFNALIERHESLRTTFLSTAGEAYQHILSHFIIELAKCSVDLTNLKKDKQKIFAENLVQQEATTSFNLSTDSLIRVKLLILAKDDHILLITLHHIISDGWSMEIFFKELSSLYNAYAQAKEPSLAPLPLQYADFSLWQREWLQGEVLEQQLSYWKEKLLNIPDLLELPTDKLRPKELSYRGASYHYTFSKEIKDQLNQLAQHHQASLFMTLLTAFQVLLYRYTGQKDIVVGYPIANRHYKEIEGLIGFFVNTLALRTTFEGHETFIDILNKIKETTLQAYQHQDVPFEQLVDHLNISRSLNRNPVFQVVFTLQNAIKDPLGLREIQVDPFYSSYPISKFDLSLNIHENEETLGVEIEYATDLFEAETIERMGNHFKELIEGILLRPNQSIQTLSLLTSSEKQQLLIEWNNTIAEYPKGKAIHLLFEEQVEKAPGNIAAIYEDQELTYQQLNERANQLAHYLRTLGVVPDTLVAIVVERSLEMIICLLGILKAGGAYVPLDPNYPPDRLQFMLEDTQAPVLLTQMSLQDRFNTYPHHLVCLNLDYASKDLIILHKEHQNLRDEQPPTLWMSLSTYSHHNPVSFTLPQHLAYVIYTSGSTGQPKGVMVGHKNVLRLLSETQQWYHFTQDDVWTLFHSYAFDFSVWEIWGALLYGGKLIIVPYLTSRSPEAFYTLLKTNNVTVLNQTPSAFYQLILYEQSLHSSNRSDSLLLRLVIFGGEPLEFHKLKPWFDIHEGENTVHFVNMYGITETTVHVTYLPIPLLSKEQTIIKEKNIIGKRIPDLIVYILDEHMNPVPIGIGGEIYIGGAGLARGYLHRPDLTAERFVPNPFVEEGKNGSESSTNMSVRSSFLERLTVDILKKDLTQFHDPMLLVQTLRLYRTGDLARYLPDGNIEFLGRRDDQVKIRGFRIELGEIESTLKMHGDVAQVVVIAREDELGSKRLVAYVVPKDEHRLSFLESTLTSSSGVTFSTLKGESLTALTEDLRHHLIHSLPEHMIPAFFVYLDKIPLTLNKKMDRKALPAPNLNLRNLGDEYVPPQTPLQEQLRGIWSEVLRIERIGIHDNFFRMGGDSIISIQLVSKARSKRIYLAVKDLFNHPTIATLALVAKTQEDARILQPIQESVIGNVPLTPIQHWFFNNHLKAPHHFNQAVLLRAYQPLDLTLLKHAFSLLLAHHDALRLRYTYQDIHWTQRCLPPHDESICQEIDLSTLPDSEFHLHIEKEASLAQQSLNIQNGPIMKVILFNGRGTQRLFLVIHHLMIDGVSWRILIEDLETLYDQLVKGKKTSLPPKTHSYQQWGHALIAYAQSEDIQQQIPYWQQIEDSIQALPIDLKHDLENGGVATTLVVSLSEEETTALLQRVPKAYRTQINDILLTALTLAIGDWTQEYRLSLALEGHGREDIIKDIDLSRTVGWFTSIFPVHLTLENSHDLGEAIKTVKETLRQIPHKGIGYGILSSLTQSALRSSVRHPSISFNYLGQWDKFSSQKSLFSFAPEPTGLCVSDQNDLSYPLNINSEVKNGTLILFLTYSQNHYQDQSIEELSHHLGHRLRQLITHCCQEENFGYTPSDFSLVSLTPKDLDSNFRIPHIEDIYPLSPMQSGLLFQSLYAPESDAYFVQSVFELHGELDPTAFKQAWQKVSDHHPILRTGFVWENLNIPFQYVLETTEVPFVYEEWPALTSQEREERFETLIQEDRKKGFDLRATPLFRLTLIHEAFDHYYLMWSQHHILLDGWCLPIIWDDVLKVYASIRHHRDIQLTSPRPYRDYIEWLQEQDLSQAEAFWKDYLSAVESPTRLSFKDLIEENKDKDYDTHSINFSLEETQQLKRLAQDQHFTLNTLFQGAVGSVLKTYTG